MPTAAPSATPADGLSPAPLHRHLVVGLGTSAGGMQALQRFFEHLPAHTGMAFVVVTHLSPSHESHAAEILQRSTGMPVLQVDEPVTMALDRVYVIPAGRGLTIADGLLQPQGDARAAGAHQRRDPAACRRGVPSRPR